MNNNFRFEIGYRRGRRAFLIQNENGLSVALDCETLCVIPPFIPKKRKFPRKRKDWKK